MRHDFHFVIMPADPDDEVGALRAPCDQRQRRRAVHRLHARPRSAARDAEIAVDALRRPWPVVRLGAGLSLISTSTTRPPSTMRRELLLQLGHTRFALMNGPAHLDFAIRRKNGVVAALAERGLTLRRRLHQPLADDGRARPDRDGAFSADAGAPTAILCSSTVLALGAIRAINQAGLKLGEDISLIAHDDVLPLLKPENFSRSADDDTLVAAGRRCPHRAAADRHGQADRRLSGAGTLEGGADRQGLDRPCSAINIRTSAASGLPCDRRQ